MATLAVAIALWGEPIPIFLDMNQKNTLGYKWLFAFHKLWNIPLPPLRINIEKP